jgi:transposase
MPAMGGKRTVTRTRITKVGDRLTRTYLTSAAQHHLRSGHSSLALWGTDLSKRLRKTGVHVAIARKLAVMMLALWKSGEHYDPYYSLQPSPDRARTMILN